MTTRKVLALSLGAQFVIGAVVGIIQAGSLLMGVHSTTISWLGAPVIAVVGIPFNTGGLTVRLVFEAWVEPLETIVGHRSAVVLSNVPFYLVLLLIQMVILSGVVIVRYRRKESLNDWMIAAVVVFVFFNGVMNMMWPWWGT